MTAKMICEMPKPIGPTSTFPSRAYVLLQSTGNSSDRVAKTLRRQQGVVAVDLVEGPPDVVVVMEAADRPELASLLMKAMTSVQQMTEGLQLLPTAVSRRTRQPGRSKN